MYRRAGMWFSCESSNWNFIVRLGIWLRFPYGSPSFDNDRERSFKRAEETRDVNVPEPWRDTHSMWSEQRTWSGRSMNKSIWISGQIVQECGKNMVLFWSSVCQCSDQPAGATTVQLHKQNVKIKFILVDWQHIYYSVMSCIYLKKWSIGSR